MKNVGVAVGVVLAGLAVLTVAAPPSIEEYMVLRNQVIQTEDSISLGGTTTLNIREMLVNEILMEIKDREYLQGLETNNGDWFAGTKHIFHAMKLIEASDIFKFIRMMPKGAALHMHDITVAPTDFFVANISKWDNLYYCIGDRNHLLFRFSSTTPTTGCPPIDDWKTVRSLRDTAPSPAFVDEFFFKSMNMMTETPDIEYPNTNVAWEMFEKKITTASGMGNYEPALREYYYNTLKYHHEDNVMYIEMRGLLSSIYHLNQTELSTIETLRVLKQETDKFLADYPDFFGAKYIYAPHRFHVPVDIGKMVDEAVAMKNEMPEYFAGFDLVGQEDKGSPLLTFLPQLLDATDKGIKFFFHAGETDWRGTRIDDNLVDAVLLNTTRFGHGYALYSHPYLYEKAKENKIAVEICPISNQILGLVKDFRNHPGFNYMKDDFPVIVAADGPGIYGTTALSHDFYIAFMAIGGEKADLRFLKKLATNSIQYSAMSEEEKASATIIWEAKWSNFLDKVLNLYSISDNNIMDNSIVP